MPIDPKVVIAAKKKILTPVAAGLRANPNDVANYKKLKQQKAKEDLDAANKGIDEDSEESLTRKTIRKESSDIAPFLKAISQKNYAQADKYLQGTVESKLKTAIDRAIKNSTIYAK
jgi:hypothetical protein